MRDYIEFERQSESALYVRIKDPAMLEASVFARMENDEYALGCLLTDEANGQLMYSTQNLIPLSKFLRGYTFEKQEGYLFLLTILEKAIAVNRSKPVLLDTDYMYVSPYGDEVYFVVLPLKLEFWMFQKNDCLCFVSQILDEMKCQQCYELPGYMIQLMKTDQFSLPNLCSGIRDLMEAYYPKKLLRKRQTGFRAKEPVHASFYQPDFSSRHPQNSPSMDANFRLPHSLDQSPKDVQLEHTSPATKKAPAPDAVSLQQTNAQYAGADSIEPHLQKNGCIQLQGTCSQTEGTASQTNSLQQLQEPVSSWELFDQQLQSWPGQPVPAEPLMPLQSGNTQNSRMWMQEDALFDESVLQLEGPFADLEGTIPLDPSFENCDVLLSDSISSSQVWQQDARLTKQLAQPEFRHFSPKDSNPLADKNHAGLQGAVQRDLTAADTKRDSKRLLQQTGFQKQPASFHSLDPILSTTFAGNSSSSVSFAEQSFQQPAVFPPVFSKDSNHPFLTQTTQNENSNKDQIQPTQTSKPDECTATMPVASLMEQEIATAVLEQDAESWGTLEWQGQSFALRFEVTTIGRHVSNDVCLPAAAVSSRHARIVKEAGKYYVQDLHSTNKTRIFGRIVQEKTELLDGMELCFGDQEAVFHAAPV